MRHDLGQLVVFISLAVGLHTPASAADPRLPDVKTFDKQVIDSLRDVHNTGADLYNKHRDYAGAYRMYQGGLLTIRPLLQHRPAAQKLIDTGLEKAELEADVARKAFLLHETIEAVRKNLKDAIRTEPPQEPQPKVDLPKEKQPQQPQPKGDPPKEPKKDPSGGNARLRGTVTFENQPLADADVVLVSVQLPRPRVFTAKTQAEGRYQFTEAIPPGTYIVVVTGAGVPARYQLTTTSPLRLELAAGDHSRNLNLQK
jgi:hypothetical protein